MQGRDEKFIKIDKEVKEKIKIYDKIVTDYYNFLTSEAKSPTTKRVYINILLNFIKYYSNSIGKTQKELSGADFSKLMVTDFYGYITFKKESGDKKPIKEPTLNLILSVMDSFSSFLYQCKIIDRSIIDGKPIKRAKIQNASSNSVTFLEPEEIKAVRMSIHQGVGNNASVEKQKNWKLRDELLFLIPIVTGIRVDALSNINVDDVDLDNNKFTATDKGNKTKEYYINDELKSILSEWLLQRDSLISGFNSQTKALFISNRRQRMNTMSIRAVVSKYTKCVDKNITPHKLRSTCGTLLYRESNDIYLVSDTLGHSSTVPTKRYTAMSGTRKREAASLIGNIL